MPTEVLAGHETYWSRLGHGSRRSILVHCALADHGAWRGLVPELGAVADLMAFDMPGHGRSAPWDGETELQGLVADIVLDLCGDGPVDLIGHSFGATAALRAAVAAPERVRSLTLIEPVLMCAALRGNAHLSALYERDMAEFRAAWARGDRAAAAQAFTDIWGGATPWNELPGRVQAALTERIHLIPAANAALHDDVGGVLAPGGIEALTCPVLLLEGSSTHWLMPHIQDALMGRLTNGYRAIIGGAGHMAPITHGQAVGREILRHCFA